MKGFNAEDITKERSLWDIYVQVRRLGSSWFNRLSTGAVFVLLVLYLIYAGESAHTVAEKVRSFSEFGLNFVAAILGFLLAGFTIFFTVSKMDLFMLMAKIEHRPTKITWLKYSFFTFMDVFIVYISFLSLCVLIKLFASSNGFLTVILKHIGSPEITKKIIASIGLIVIGTWLFYLVISLKSFIFNIYHIAMTAIRWEVEKKDGEAK